MDYRYGLDDRPPAGEWLLLGLQWFAVAVPSIVILGKVICHAGTAGCDPVSYLQKLFFVAGAFIAIQVLTGHRLPLIVGPSTIILIGILASPGAEPEAVYTAIFLGGILLGVAALAGLFEKLERFFTRRVVAIVLLLIAFTLTPTIIRLITAAEGGATPASGAAFALAVVVLMLVLNRLMSGIWRSTLILIGTVIGTAAYHLLYAPPASPGGVPPAFSAFWSGMRLSLVFDPGLLLAFFICYLALALNDMGSIESLKAFVPESERGRRLRRGIAVTGVANAVSGLLGVIGQVNYSMSPGVIAASRCLSRFALLPAAALMGILAFSPAAIAVVDSIPSAVVGSVMTYILCAQFSAGLMILQEECTPLEFSDGLVIGLPLLAAIVVAFLPAGVVQSFPALIRPVAGNSFVVGVILVLILEHGIYRRPGG